MQIRIAKDLKDWNDIVDKSPYSVLHHRYELFALVKNGLPLVIEEQGYVFLFPLQTIDLFKSFRLVSSPIYFHASLLPECEEAVYLIPEALDDVRDFLRDMKVDYLSTCAPAFWSKRYTTVLNSWFKKHKASVQIVYSYMIPTRNTSFEEIWKRRFRRRVREEIRKAEREGVSVIKIDTVGGIYEWAEDIFRCNVSALKRQGRWGAYPDSYKDVYLSELILSKKLLREHFNLYGAIYGERLIAYIIVQEYNKFMEPTKALSRTRFLAKHPNDVLLAHLVKEACERGFHWFGYGWDRVKRDGQIPSLFPGVQMWRRKFGFDEIPIPIYRLGLTRTGKIIQHAHSCREYIITRSAYLPESVRVFLIRLYAPRRRKLSIILGA